MGIVAAGPAAAAGEIAGTLFGMWLVYRAGRWLWRRATGDSADE